MSFLKNPNFLKNIFLAILTGTLLGLSFPPFKTGFLAYFALVPLLVLLDRLRGKLQVLRYSYFTIFVFHVISIYWIGGWGERTDVFMEIGAVALIIIHPIFYWLPISLYVYVKRNLSPKLALFSFPFLWTALEYLRSVDETAFPWLTLGNTQSYYLPIIQISSFIGVYGISFIIILFNILIYFAYKNFRQNTFRFFLNKIAIVIIILLVLFIYGKVVLNEATENGKKIKVGMIQPNIDPWDKWESGDIITQLELFLTLSDSAVSKGAEFLIWPETAIPVYILNGSYPNELRRIQEYLSKKKIPLLTGLPLAEFYYRKEDAHRGSKPSRDSAYWYDSYNGTVLFIPDEYNYQTYGKIKLVPFSERTPYLEYVPFLGDLIKWQVGISNWSVGRKHTIFSFKTSDGDSAKFSTLVCYES
ncbi:MAG: apolipoprotein N-acyltransferase, partial [Ignavibacteria bacterium]|nr:apolipoprotein N-acyltransferase [Ignavibacteria bacterium]